MNTDYISCQIVNAVHAAIEMYNACYNACML